MKKIYDVVTINNLLDCYYDIKKILRIEIS